MMLYDEFRETGRIDKVLKQIRKEATGSYKFMEVCGGHTTSIQSFGIESILPPGIVLVTGPGCPVCVTSRSYIDHAIELSCMPDVLIATFGDLLRVPGTNSTLEKEKAGGAGITVVYSVNEALALAEKHRNRKIVFLGVGFETTAPGSAAGIIDADRRGLGNFFFLSAHKIMPPAMRAVATGGTDINGFICPGHVSAIAGSGIYRFISIEFGIGCVISGFEPLDILQSVLMLIRQVNRKEPCTEIQYIRAVKPEGNQKAIDLMEKVFEISDDWWRGFGVIPGSGLQPRTIYERYDARKAFRVFREDHPEEDSCICGEVLRGISKPENCPLFGSACAPDNPVGACMVSSEGACNIYFKYRKYA